jgi:thymidylate synthase
MSKFEDDYRALLIDILGNGSPSNNRTGVDTIKLFNKSMTIDLRDGFPIVTGKLVDFEYGKTEFDWIMNGYTNTKYLNDRGVGWWNQFADENGNLGRIYGYQFRSFNGVFDQYEYVVNEIRENSRRAIITFWNPCDLDEQSLPCCYTSFNFVRDGNELNMVMNFRSSDTFLGLPYDIIMGALMLLKVAKRTGLRARFLGISIADAHIYSNHILPVKKYLEAKTYPLPIYSEVTEKIFNYKCSPYIKAKLNV